MSATTSVLLDIHDERARQDCKWGEQNHPDGTSHNLFNGKADQFRLLCDTAAREGQLTWADILLEEVYEALAEEDLVRLRTELVQVAAVATGWVEAIDRRDDW